MVSYDGAVLGGDDDLDARVVTQSGVVNCYLVAVHFGVGVPRSDAGYGSVGMPGGDGQGRAGGVDRRVVGVDYLRWPESSDVRAVGHDGYGRVVVARRLEVDGRGRFVLDANRRGCEACRAGGVVSHAGVGPDDGRCDQEEEWGCEDVTQLEGEAFRVGGMVLGCICLHGGSGWWFCRWLPTLVSGDPGLWSRVSLSVRNLGGVR